MSLTFNPYGLSLLNDGKGNIANPYEYKPLVSGYPTSLAAGDAVSLMPFPSTNFAANYAPIGSGTSAAPGTLTVPTGSVIKTPLNISVGNGANNVAISSANYIPIYGVFALVKYWQNNLWMDDQVYVGGTQFQSIDGTASNGQVGIITSKDNRYKIQANGPVTQDMIGLNFNLSYQPTLTYVDNTLANENGTPDMVTRQSTTSLNVKPALGVGNNAAWMQCVIEGLAEVEDNKWGDLFTQVIVRINCDRYTTGVSAVAAA